MPTHKEEVLKATGIDISSETPMTPEELAKLVDFIQTTDEPATKAFREVVVPQIFTLKELEKGGSPKRAKFFKK